VEPPGEAKPVWWIMQELAKRLGYDLKCESAQQIWDAEISELSPSMAGIKYDLLEKGGLQWPKPSREHPGTVFLHQDGNFSRGKGQFAVIEHSEPAEVPDREYPFWLTTGRRLQQYHSSTMTRRAKGLSELLPEERLELNPEDAKTLGVLDGEVVRVRSRRGEVRTKAWVTDKVPPKTVFMSFHFWEANANFLTNAALDPACKVPEYKACAVAVEKAG
jgi:formate dehydrogenase major subunit